MSKYYVSLPVTLEISVLVDAESEKDAIEKGFEVEWTLNAEGCDVMQCETHMEVCRGNVCGAVLNKAYATLETED